jgi:multicomponent K+:H+ antiporter subunit A
MNLLLAVLLPLAVGPWLVPLAARFGRSAAAWTAAALTATALVLVWDLTPSVLAGETVIAAWSWFPQLGLSLAFRLDGLSLLFAGLILVIGLLVILYARYYLSEEDSMGRLLALLMLFMGAMLGVVMSENLLLMFVFWELTSLSSFLLVGYWTQRQDAREGARMALAVTATGGLALLGGLLLLYQITGSFELTHVLASNERIIAHPLYTPMLLLVLLGAFTKSAQFPFHFWLPHAMAAPTPVSAYLHSATMVKAGVFLLARLYPALSGTDLFFFLVSGVGIVTLAFAAFVAIFQQDLKGLLAYSTISHLGLIMFLIGLESPLAAVAAVFHIINHATFKASLFMAAGIIDHETGTRDMRKLNGLFKYMPITATLAMVAAAAMAGVPLLNGFLSKEMFFGEALGLRGDFALWWIFPLVATLAGACGVAYSIRFIHDVFFNGEPVGLTKKPHEPPRWMRVPVELLVGVCLVVGLVPGLVMTPILTVAAQAMLGAPAPAFSLAIWHGFNLPLAMSVLAMVIGAGLYFWLQRVYNLHRLGDGDSRGRRLFDLLVTGLVDLSRRLVGAVANGSLQRYLVFFLLATLLAGILPFMRHGYQPGTVPTSPTHGGAAVIWLLLVASAIATVVFHRQRFVALVMLGIAGLASAVVFIGLSAPDLALTQLSVEVVSIILMLLALYLLPQEAPREGSALRHGRDLALALIAGGGTAALVYAVLTRPLETLSWFYLEQSVPGGGGTNVVNVILVDFRGFDTFGEITVLAIASLVIYALLRTLRMDLPVTGAPPADEDRHPLMLRVTSRAVLPFALMVAVYLFLRGHNQPGGGFVAGLVTAVALIVQYLASGINWTEHRLNVRFYRIAGLGLLVAGATGVGSFFFDAPFLTSAHGHPRIPVLGEVPLASAALFDLGVFLTVVGAMVLSLTALSHVNRNRTI